MSSYSTIHQTFKTIALAEQQRMDACAAAIKITQATAPTLVVNPTLRGPKGQGNVAKLSPAGVLMGWYRDNQKSGLPNRLMLIARQMETLFQLYEKSVIKGN